MLKTKAECRNWAKKVRKTLDVKEIGDLICQNIIKQDFFRNNVKILAYYPAYSELDITQLFQVLDKQWYLPRCDLSNQTFEAHLYRHGDNLIENIYQILEPSASSDSISPNDLDIIILPALVGDVSGNRIGYGAGYYDRYLNLITPDVITVMPLPDCLLLDFVPNDDWDKKIDFVITEKRVIKTL